MEKVIIYDVFACHSDENNRLYAEKKHKKSKMIYGSYKDNPNCCEPYIAREVFDEIKKK